MCPSLPIFAPPVAGPAKPTNQAKPLLYGLSVVQLTDREKIASRQPLEEQFIRQFQTARPCMRQTGKVQDFKEHGGLARVKGKSHGPSLCIPLMPRLQRPLQSECLVNAFRLT